MVYSYCELVNPMEDGVLALLHLVQNNSYFLQFAVCCCTKQKLHGGTNSIHHSSSAHLHVLWMGVVMDTSAMCSRDRAIVVDYSIPYVLYVLEQVRWFRYCYECCQFSF